MALPPPKELFYTEGPPELQAARLEIAVFSLQRASARVAAQKAEQQQKQEVREDGDAMEVDGEQQSLGKFIFIRCVLMGLAASPPPLLASPHFLLSIPQRTGFAA